VREIIVTGGTGFIGSKLCAKLVSKGLHVHVWSRGETNLSSITDSALITYRPIDIYNEKEVLQALRDTQVKEMIHLAWGGLPHYTSCHHIDVELVNQIRFVRTVVENGIEHLTQTGTCFEYGMREGELSEDMDCNPDNPYGYAKLALQRYTAFLSKEVPFSYRWLRLFYMYGEGQSSTSLYTMLRAAYERGDTSFDMSAGHQIRDFLPVSEVVERIFELHSANLHSGVYNICSGKPMSVRQMVENWSAEWDYKVNFNLGRFPIPTYEPLAFWGSNTHTENALRNIQ